jgi:hypothetical protein
MQIRVAHLRAQGIDFAVFDADATSHLDSDRATLLMRLTAAARAKGLKVDKSALAFHQGSQTRFYGTPDLVRFLANNGISRWTHTISI